MFSLPPTSILALIWLYGDTHDVDQVASLSWSILWAIVPSVVFLIALTVAVYGVWVLIARRIGLDI